MKTTHPSTPTIKLPSREDPFVAASSGVIGGPVGAHANLRRRFWTPIRVCLLLGCLVLALGWLQKSPCQEGMWQNFSQYRQFCYTDIFALYYAEELNTGAVPYVDHAVEYPVLTGFLMGTIGLPVHHISQTEWFGDVLEKLHHFGLIESAQPNEAMYFYNLTSLVLAAFSLLVIWAIARTRTSRPWDAAMMALAPAMVFTAFVNWDLLAVGLTALALCAWGRRRLVLAGLLFGLATAAKFYPLLILGPLALLCLRSSKLPAFFTTLGTAFATWIVVNLPVYLVAPKSWLKFYEFSQERGVDWGTFWYVGAHWPRGDDIYGFSFFRDLSLGENLESLNTLTTVLLVLCCIGIAALILFAPLQPRLSQVAFLIVAVFLLTNKVWSQQFVLWLIPLFILAHPKWRAFLLWQLCELLYFLSFYQIQLSVSGGKALLPQEAFTYAAALRWLSVAILCGLVVYEILHPERDVVRTGGIQDPEGGVLVDSLTGGPAKQFSNNSAPAQERDVSSTSFGPTRGFQHNPGPSIAGDST